ncbi:MAG: trigger factor [Eubacteriales bacterium]|nr:trigger factor [Eubacteriales bacterium]MDD4474540.1 trigger factor [Eubacteriales bacterium]
MSLKSVSKPENNKYELEIVIPKADFDAAVDAVYKKSVGDISVPGFRKGKAPKKIIEKMYGADVFRDEAIDMVLPALYREAIAEAKLEPVADPMIDFVSSDDDGIVVKAVVTNKPEITVGEYKGLEAVKYVQKVTDEMVDAEVAEVRKRNGRMITVEDRAAENGDTTVIDFEGFVDGVAFEGGKGEDYSLVLGSGSFIPGFEEQVVGHKTGEEFDVNVSFPEEYHAENLKGKPAVFKIKLKEIKHLDLPELDDEFAKDVSEFDTLAEYRESIKAKIADRFEKNADSGLERNLEEKLIEISEVEIPEVMIANEVESHVRDYEQRLRSNGASLDLYLKYTGSTLEQLREQFKPAAEKGVKCRLALEKIAKIEEIEIEETVFEEEYKKIAESYGIDVDTVKKSITNDMLEPDLKTRKAFELVKNAAVVTEKEQSEESEVSAE